MLADCAKRVSFDSDGRWPENSYLEVSNICCKSPLRLVQPGRMDKTIRKYAGVGALDEIKAQEYRYWQSRPLHERTDAVSELNTSYVRDEGRGPECTPTSKNSCPF